MKWLDHRSKPCIRAYNYTRGAVASLNKVLTPMGGTAYSFPSMFLDYQQQLVHTSDAAYIDQGGHWYTARGAERKFGLMNGIIVTQIYSYAAELVETYPSQTVSGWGIIDRTGVTAADVSDNAGSNPFGITYRLTGNTLWVSPNDPYGSTDELTAANFYSRGFGIRQANGTGDWWVDLFGTDPGPGYSNVGVENAALWRRWPYTEIGGPSDYNYVGGSAGFYDVVTSQWMHASPRSYVNVKPGQVFSLPNFIRGRSNSVLSARMEVKFANLQRFNSTVTTTITDEETGARTTEGQESTELDDIGVVVLGARRDGTMYEWDVLASASGGTGADNHWMIVDATDIVNAMIAARGTYHAFAVVPTPAQEALGNVDSLAYLKSMRPEFTLDYWDDGSGLPTMNEAAANPEGTYIAESTGSYVTWDSCEIGNIEISFDPLLGEDGQVVLPGVSFPRMD